MKNLNWLCAGALAIAAFASAAAQEQSSATMSPPKILTITREFVKPGKAGAMHDKTESAFVQAMAHAKWQTHYLGMNSITGKSRSLFFTGYESFEAWEKDVAATQKNAMLSASLDRAGVTDGELLDSMDASAFVYNAEYSLNQQSEHATPATRYFEISVYHTKEGHHKEWDEGVKMVLEAYKKALPDAHWACYESAFGAPEGTFLFIVARKSANEIDTNFAHNKDFASAMGEDGMKKLDELAAASIESSETNLFALNPNMSYVPAEWIKADDFWKPKTATSLASAPKKPAEKPAEKTGAGQ
ncbi:MAG: hypothetical protein JOZ80_02890 [Acidobacteriaceae bacterium]|nr:hypothetical protein [Acidobacteriaceae bacterium]